MRCLLCFSVDFIGSITSDSFSVSITELLGCCDLYVLWLPYDNVVQFIKLT